MSEVFSKNISLNGASISVVPYGEYEVTIKGWTGKAICWPIDGDGVYWLQNGKDGADAGIIDAHSQGLFKDLKWSWGHDSSVTSVIPLMFKDKVKNMTLLEKIALARKGEPEKSFIKAGILKMDGSFTTGGQSAFMDFLLEKFGADFKTGVVDDLLKEIEKESKK